MFSSIRVLSVALAALLAFPPLLAAAQTPIPMSPPQSLPQLPPEPEVPPEDKPEPLPPEEQTEPVAPEAEEPILSQDEVPLPEMDENALQQAAPPLPPPVPMAADIRNEREGFIGLLRAQVLMDRAWVSPGEIDGRRGTNTVRAIGGFQRLAGLPVTGHLDESTWDALEKYGPALQRYVLSAQDVKGPFRSIPGSMYGKARLPALSYNNVLEALGEKFHIRPAALQELNPGVDMSQAGVEIIVPNVLDIPALPQATRIVVSDAAKLLMLINHEGKVYAQFPVSTGSERDPLPIGQWELRSVARNPHYNYNPALFKGAAPGPRATLPPGPNSPVGVMWMGLSKPHYGIHGTPEPGNISKSHSNGCIRMTNWSVLQVSNAVSQGTPVTLIP